ncbi:MAG: PQQ-like beta-propeller repeat protein [Planctomycetaceae bacterium]|nr:PQQ-like beta-propeller repeat protein [Planctomycetaceae bacterium]
MNVQRPILKSAITSICWFGLTINVATAAVLVPSDDWTQWRGPNRAGRSEEAGLMMEWPSGGPKQLWTNAETGLGYGGISVAQGTLFTVGAFGQEEFLLAIDAASGKEKWRTLLGPLFVNNWGDGPRSTPTLDDGRVYALSAQGHLVCCEQTSGKEVWKIQLTDFGGSVPQWGYSESPLVDDGRVIVTPGGSEGAIMAVDKMSGKLLWQSESCQGTAHYSSVIAAQPNGQKQYVQLLMERLVGLDPKTGKQLWSADWPGRVAVIPTPIADGNRIYVTSGYGVGCMMVQIAEDNSVSEVYRNKVMKNHHGGVILVGKHLYGYSDGPGWTCQDLETGESIWEETDALGKGCVTYAGGRLIMQSEDKGDVVLVEPSDAGWRERGRFTLSPQSTQRKRDGRIWTHPVVVDGKLYLKDQEILYCYDIKQ